MKKIFLIVLLVGLMGSSAIAGQWYEGKLARVNAVENGHFFLEIKLADGTMSPYIRFGNLIPAHAKKQMIAVILVAKASNMTVRMYEIDGKWNRVILP